jgi:hypothetical protein
MIIAIRTSLFILLICGKNFQKSYKPFAKKNNPQPSFFPNSKYDGKLTD